MGIRSDLQQWYSINEVEDDNNDDRDLTTPWTWATAMYLFILLLLVEVDDIALLVTVET